MNGQASGDFRGFHDRLRDGRMRVDGHQDVFHGGPQLHGKRSLGDEFRYMGTHHSDPADAAGCAELRLPIPMTPVEMLQVAIDTSVSALLGMVNGSGTVLPPPPV